MSSLTQKTPSGFLMSHNATFGYVFLRFSQGRFIFGGEGLIIHRGTAQGPPGLCGLAPEGLKESQSHLQLVFRQGVDQCMELFAFPHDGSILTRIPRGNDIEPGTFPDPRKS